MHTDLIPLANPKPSALFVPGGLSQILAAIEQDARSIVLDVTTRKGREQIASVAAKVARSKTYLDGLGKDYVAELKRLPGQVDAERKAMRDRLDTLRDEIRAPLTAWEAEEERKERATADLERAISAPVLMGTSSAAICDRLAEIQIIEMPAGISDAQMERIVTAIEAATPMLTTALDGALKAEAQALEVARLQREEEARRQREREERIAREAEERGRAMAEAAAKRDLEMRERKLELDRLEAERAAAQKEADDRHLYALEAASLQQRELSGTAERWDDDDTKWLDQAALDSARALGYAQGRAAMQTELWEIAEALSRGLAAALALGNEEITLANGHRPPNDELDARVTAGLTATDRLAKLRLERDGQGSLL